MTTPLLTLTDSAVRRLCLLQDDGQHTHMRLGVQGGGCAGYAYSFTLESHVDPEHDFVVEREGARVVVDRLSASLIAGSTLDFGESLLESGFRVTNPKAESSCGCGISFSLADD